MTAYQAIQKIDTHALSLGKDDYPELTVARVSRMFSAEYERLNDGFASQAITPKEYADGAIALINRFAEFELNCALDEIIAELA
jgi:hypothetical protein